MTLLMHAAYRGNDELCRVLLEHGADVNCNSHSQGVSHYLYRLFLLLLGELTDERGKVSFCHSLAEHNLANAECDGCGEQ